MEQTKLILRKRVVNKGTRGSVKSKKEALGNEGRRSARITTRVKQAICI